LFKDDEIKEHLHDDKKKQSGLTLKQKKKMREALHMVQQANDLPGLKAVLRDFGLKDDDPAFQRCVKLWYENHGLVS